MPRDLFADPVQPVSSGPRDLFASETQVAEATPEENSFLQDTANVAYEFAAGVNRPVAEFLDFVGPDTINAFLNVVGSEKRVPTLAENIPGIEGNFMEQGGARTAVRLAGNALPMAAGMKTVPTRDMTKAADVAAEFAGVGASKIAQPVVNAGGAAVDVIQDNLPSKARTAAKLPLMRRTGDVSAAGFKLDDAGNVVRDKAQKQAISAGLDEGAVAMISAANSPTKSRIKDMVAIIEKGKNNLEFRNFNTPQKVVGEAIGDRLRVIQTANKSAARRLDGVANSLKGQPVDISTPINGFLSDLADEGIAFNPKTGALDFSDSTIEGLTEAQSIIKRVVKRLYDTKDPTKNAYKVHTAKKFIDEQVSYGKTQAGLSGRMENIAKSLRRGLDGELDAAFPEYNRVNTAYSETRGVIDELQGLAGKKVNLSGENVDKALGTMSRKVLSNYNTGVATEDLFKSLDDVARRYSTPLTDSVDDELFKLVSTEAELRKMFPTAVKPNTFQGEIGTEVMRGAIDAKTGDLASVMSRVSKTAKSIFGKDDEAKIKALKDLLVE